MGTQFIVLALFLIILGSLASALFYLIKGSKEEPQRTVKALTFRIGLSVLAFIILIASYFLGYIQPNNPFP